MPFREMTSGALMRNGEIEEPNFDKIGTRTRNNGTRLHPNTNKGYRYKRTFARQDASPSWLVSN
jgi:hypothetical protein